MAETVGKNCGISEIKIKREGTRRFLNFGQVHQIHYLAIINTLYMINPILNCNLCFTGSVRATALEVIVAHTVEPLLSDPLLSEFSIIQP